MCFSSNLVSHNDIVCVFMMYFVGFSEPYILISILYVAKAILTDMLVCDMNKVNLYIADNGFWK